MPILSSGQAFEISSQRARYHATRLNIHVHRDTPHRQLYKLVDIVIPVNRKTRYQFSGLTLADEDWLHSLIVADQRCLLDWLEESHVRYEIEGARRKLIYDDLPAAITSHPYPEYLYSSLRKLVSAIPVTCMPARQWQQTLMNLQQKGIRQEELKWSGVMAYLATSDVSSETKISKEAILAHIDFSSIHFEMTTELVSDKSKNNKLANRGKYRHISLSGGEDYREWLVSLPDYQESYFGSHFTERNIMLHVRTKTRNDSKGRKLLFIEEIQSDWHQPGIKNTNSRCRARVPPAPFRQEWVALGLKLMLLHAVKEGFDGLAWADGNIQTVRYRVDNPTICRIYDKTINKNLLRLSRNWNGRITMTEIETRVPWFRLEKPKLKRGHEAVKLPAYNRQQVLSILEQYSQTELMRVPVFSIPKGMVHAIQTGGLPLFGDKLIQKSL